MRARFRVATTLRVASNLRMVLAVSAAIVLAIAACNSPTASQPAPTPSLTAIGQASPPAVATTPGVHEITQRSPIPIATSTATQVIGTGVPFPTPTACNADSEFVADVTIPDNTPIKRGQSFTKTWRLRNSGTCAWDNLFTFAMISIDDGLSTNEPEIAMPSTAPGETVDIEVALRVDSDAQIGAKLRATFQIRKPDGSFFGNKPYVQVTAAAAEGQPGAGTISGVVWLDYCSPGGEGSPQAEQKGTCVEVEGGGKEADGIRQNNESGIGGVLVELHQTTCTGTVLQTSPTATDGTFIFTRLNGGVYCIVINASRTGNDSILIPGGWTFPAGDTGTQIVTLAEGEIKTGVDFGWDKQFD